MNRFKFPHQCQCLSSISELLLCTKTITIFCYEDIQGLDNETLANLVLAVS